MARKPTQKQIECYYMAMIYKDPRTGRSLTHQQIGQTLKMKRSNVTYLLLRLKKNHPMMFPTKREASKPSNILRLDENKMSDKVVNKF